MPSGARMPHQGAPMGPPGSPYMGSPAVRPGLAPAGMEPARKRAAPPPGQSQAQGQGQPVPTAPARSRSAKRRKMADPIVINHVISVDPSDQKKTACYDIDVEVEEPLKGQMSSFLLSTANQQEISALDSKIHETIESINQLKIQRDFMLSFSRDPKGYVQDLLRSQSRDLKVMTDVAGNPEEERRAEFYHQPWSQEAVSRYFYCKIQQRRQELEQSLVVRNT